MQAKNELDSFPEEEEGEESGLIIMGFHKKYNFWQHFICFPKTFLVSNPYLCQQNLYLLQQFPTSDNNNDNQIMLEETVTVGTVEEDKEAEDVKVDLQADDPVRQPL